MTITRDNYEPFFLDFMEGNLEESQVGQFMDFLELNPDLKEELLLLENMALPDEQIIFSGKDRLYKTSDDLEAITESKLIASLEGDLDGDERKSFESWLSSHPESQREYKLFSKTRLIPNPTVKFQGKRSLYRKSGKMIMLAWVARVAAVLVLLWGINSLFHNENTVSFQNDPIEVAKLTPKKELANQIESEKKNSKIEVQNKTKSEKELTASKTKNSPEEKRPAVAKLPERDLTVLAEISPRLARLDRIPVETQLAFSYPVNVQKINDRIVVMTIDEFLASRARKAGNEGLLSAHRIIRAGLGVAAELSGERIGYKEKDGKITSVGFESKLMAFSIPLKKE